MISEQNISLFYIKLKTYIYEIKSQQIVIDPGELLVNLSLAKTCCSGGFGIFINFQIFRLRNP